MIITCTQCKEQIFEDYDFCSQYSENETYYFCSKTCEHEWLLTTDKKINIKKLKENRQCSRSLINWSVTIKTAKRTIGGKTRDVSPAGAFIHCDRPMNSKDVFFLSIHIHSGTVSFSSLAESVWSTHNGMGVKFNLERPEQGELLYKFIADA